MGGEISRSSLNAPQLVAAYYATLIMHVPVEDIELLRQPELKNAMEQDTRTTITLPAMHDPEQTEGTSYWAPVKIQGECRSLYDCYNRIEQLVDDVDEVIVELPISKMCIASIFGRDSTIVKTIGADSGVRIRAPRLADKYPNPIVTLEGNFDEVAKAVESFITAVINSGQTRATTVLDLTSQQIKAVIGANGSTIKQICFLTGARCKVVEKNDSRKSRSESHHSEADTHDNKDEIGSVSSNTQRKVCIITGARDSVNFASQIIKNIKAGLKPLKAASAARDHLRSEGQPVMMTMNEAFWTQDWYDRNRVAWMDLNMKPETDVTSSDANKQNIQTQS